MTEDAKRAEFLRRAGEAFDRMTKEDQEQMITFEQMEERALEVGSKLECWLLEQSLAAAAERQRDQTACCPQCHKPLRMKPPEERRVLALTGEVTLQRAQGYCTSCRKSFSPGGRATEAQRRGLQPSAGTQDRQSGRTVCVSRGGS